MEAILSFIPVPVAVILMAAGFVSLASAVSGWATRLLLRIWRWIL